MGLKDNSSFLKFVTMGALAARSSIEKLKSLGFQPVELERYCTSNKIWKTKVKRLRLPDLLCTKTGVRFEIRAKSDLTIKMSHTDSNIDRTWDAGLRNEDVVVFLAVDMASAKPAIGPLQPFLVSDLRKTFHSVKIGQPKSASEGSEKDIEWPSWSPNQSGIVTLVSDEVIKVEFDSGRKYSYKLNNKYSYVKQNHVFKSGEEFLAGTVPKKLDLSELCNISWDPIAAFASNNHLDRYSSAKACSTRLSDNNLLKILEKAFNRETEERVKLEIAGALAKHNNAMGIDHLISQIHSPSIAFLSMEALLIATELGNPAGMKLLEHVACDPKFDSTELQQAALWGLGTGSYKNNNFLIDFISHKDDQTALNAICAFESINESTTHRLASMIMNGSPRERSSAIQVISQNGTLDTARILLSLYNDQKSYPLIAALGKLPKELVINSNPNNHVLDLLKPIYSILDPIENWLSPDEIADELLFIKAQKI